VSDGLEIRGRYEQALVEVEEMKRTLREHAQRVAAREKELEQLRLEVAGRQGRRRPSASDRPSAPDPARQDELNRKIAAAEKREQAAAQELALAKAERERLDEREQTIRKVERELAGLRVQLQGDREHAAGGADAEPGREPDPAADPPPPTPLPQPPDDSDLEPAAKLRRSSMLADPQLRKQH
jgi:predicted  nucleic acid-binding Zn-ribbon protein